MQVIPAIDLKIGVCVRLRKGSENALTEYSPDPVTVAREWEQQGARRLHVVNLDGAFGRTSRNLDVLREIASHTEAIVEFGGGLRGYGDIERAFGSGADKAVLGTVAVESPDLVSRALGEYGPERVIVALDGRGGKIATRGWKETTGLLVLDLCKRMKELGVQEILYTDIERDGMLEGMDLALLQELAALDIDVIASGGLSSVEDLKSLISLGSPRVTGVVVGKALYEKRVSLEKLIEIALGSA